MVISQYYTSTFLIVISMFAQIYLVIGALKLIQFGMFFRNSFNAPFKVVFIWVCLEATILISALLSNASYLLIRSFRRQAVDLELENTTCHEESDNLEARQIEIGYVNSWLTPFFTCVFIRLAAMYPISESIEPHLQALTPMTETLILLFGLQFLFGSFLFFVHNHEGFSCNRDCWIKIGPYVHILFALFTFFVVPLITFFMYIAWKRDNMKTIFSPIILFFSLNGVVNFAMFCLQMIRILLSGLESSKQRLELRNFELNEAQYERNILTEPFDQNQCPVCGDNGAGV
jgi:hypothetical protein